MTPLPTVNQQPIEKVIDGDGSCLEIVDSPFATVQGEGIFSGWPAVFVRLAGCDLQCPGCDTNYTHDRRLWSLAQLRGSITVLTKKMHHTGFPLVVITGGEPFRQPIGPLVRELCLSDYTVQIETNGTLYRDDLPWVSPNLFVVCSPKTPTVHPKLVPHVSAWKYPIRAGEVDPDDGLPTSILGGLRPYRPGKKLIYVTPMDEGDTILQTSQYQANQQAAVDSATKFGYVLGLQVHKLVGVP